MKFNILILVHFRKLSLYGTVDSVCGTGVYLEGKMGQSLILLLTGRSNTVAIVNPYLDFNLGLLVRKAIIILKFTGFPVPESITCVYRSDAMGVN